MCVRERTNAESGLAVAGADVPSERVVISLIRQHREPFLRVIRPRIQIYLRLFVEQPCHLSLSLPPLTLQLFMDGLGWER